MHRLPSRGFPSRAWRLAKKDIGQLALNGFRIARMEAPAETSGAAPDSALFLRAHGGASAACAKPHPASEFPFTHMRCNRPTPARAFHCSFPFARMMRPLDKRSRIPRQDLAGADTVLITPEAGGSGAEMRRAPA